jgi:hypothetical protein
MKTRYTYPFISGYRVYESDNASTTMAKGESDELLITFSMSTSTQMSMSIITLLLFFLF